MVQRLSEACKAHQADRELSSADSNILELDAVVRRRQAVRPFRALDLLHCQRPLSPVILQQALTSFCWPFVSEKRVKPLPAVACKLSPFLHLYEYKDLDTPKILAHWKTFTSQLTVVVDKLYDLPVDSNDLMRQRFLHRQAYLELIRTEQKKRSLTAQLKRPFDFS